MSDTNHFKTATLPNGLTVLGEPDPRAETVAAGYFVRTGARDEVPAELGVSHFLEHMLFKGSEAVGAAELNARLDALGGSVNAFTSEESTVYHAASLPERASDLLSTLTELMQPALRPAEFETERGVILEEIAMYADQPGARVFDALRADYWGEHPVGHNVLGTVQTVSNLTPAAMRANFEARYGTGRVTLVACGHFDWDALLEQTERLTAGWPRTDFTRALRPATPHAGLRVLPDDRLGRVSFAACTPGWRAADPRREAVQVLADLIGGDNGRLHWALVDTGLADGADLSHSEFEETGSFEAGWSCDPERAQQTLDVFRNVLETVQRDGVTELEVRRARKKLAVGTLLRAETPYGRLFTLGMDQLALGAPLSLEGSVARYEAVTLDDVQALLAERPFDTVQVAALGPIKTLN